MRGTRREGPQPPGRRWNSHRRPGGNSGEQRALRRAWNSEPLLKQKGLCASCQLVLLQLILPESELARENGKTHLSDKSTPVPSLFPLLCLGLPLLTMV